MARALEGIRVLDMSHVVAAPTTTMYLGDLGAEIIHVEPHSGDDLRIFPPFYGDPGKNNSAYFIQINRNKKSIVIDLKKESGMKIIHDLIKASDVLIENFRPTTMRKLGLGWEEIKEINPKIIYASISGFGHDSLPAYDKLPAYDMVAQGYSGLLSITGPEGGMPCRVGSVIGDFMAGHQAAIGILAALIYREKTGKGQRYDGSMVDGLFSITCPADLYYNVKGEIGKPLGNSSPALAPFTAFQTADTSIITPIGNDRLWGVFCKVLGCPELIFDERFKTNYHRTKNRKELEGILQKIFKEKTTKEWMEIFKEKQLPCSPINTMKEICEDPNIAYRKMLVEIEQTGIGKIKIAGSTIKLSETPGEVYAPAPLLGEHTDYVLKNVLSYEDGFIDSLKNNNVVCAAKTD